MKLNSTLGLDALASNWHISSHITQHSATRPTFACGGNTPVGTHRQVTQVAPLDKALTQDSDLAAQETHTVYWPLFLHYNSIGHRPHKHYYVSEKGSATPSVCISQQPNMGSALCAADPKDSFFIINLCEKKWNGLLLITVIMQTNLKSTQYVHCGNIRPNGSHRANAHLSWKEDTRTPLSKIMLAFISARRFQGKQMIGRQYS